MNADRIRVHPHGILCDDADVPRTNGTPLFERRARSGRLLQLVAFLEEEFEIEVRDEDVTVECTTTDIVDVVKSRVVERRVGRTRGFLPLGEAVTMRAERACTSCT